MNGFSFADQRIDAFALTALLRDPSAGGFSSFEGWVRDHNEGQRVLRLEYEAYVELAVKEGSRIVADAIQRFGVVRACCVHRVGLLEIGETAVWVGASAAHRAEAFAACRYIIDEVKHRVPIWKKEYYANGDSGWVNCERCAAPGVAPVELLAAHRHDHGRPHAPATHDVHRHEPPAATGALKP